VKRVLIFFTLMFSIASFGMPRAHAQAPSSQEFAERAAMASQFAIEASNIALKRSTDRKVTRLAKEIIEDYQKGNTYISEAAASNNLRIPDRLSPDLQARLQRLEDASPNDIDTLFMREVTRMHSDAIPLFTAYSQAGDILRLRFLAGRALPTLREHYGNLQQLVASAR
jgi:putative membrane protein